MILTTFMEKDFAIIYLLNLQLKFNVIFFILAMDQ